LGDQPFLATAKVGIANMLGLVIGVNDPGPTDRRTQVVQGFARRHSASAAHYAEFVMDHYARL
jgi:hypothetical protein